MSLKIAYKKLFIYIITAHCFPGSGSTESRTKTFKKKIETSIVKSLQKWNQSRKMPTFQPQLEGNNMCFLGSHSLYAACIYNVCTLYVQTFPCTWFCRIYPGCETVPVLHPRSGIISGPFVTEINKRVKGSLWLHTFHPGIIFEDMHCHAFLTLTIQRSLPKTTLTIQLSRPKIVVHCRLFSPLAGKAAGRT